MRIVIDIPLDELQKIQNGDLSNNPLSKYIANGKEYSKLVTKIYSEGYNAALSEVTN